MRILNKRQLDQIPMVDEANLYLGADNAQVEANRASIARDNVARARIAQLRQQNLQNRALKDEQLRARANMGYANMLKRSLRNTGKQAAMGAAKPSDGRVKQFGVNNAQLGFVDECCNSTVLSDYESRETYDAQEFSNKLTNHDAAAYTKFKDYPLVVDAPRGDFGGILTNEQGTADFSEWIVNDSQQDFGYVPKRHMKRQRK